MAERIGGIINVQVNGETQNAKGSWTVFPGNNKRDGVMGADRHHGFKEMPQQAAIEGIISDRLTLDIDAMLVLKNSTVSIRLPSGKTGVLRDAYYAGSGELTTEEGELAARFEGSSLDIVT